MWTLILWIVVLIVSLFVLVRAADYFTDSASRIGVYFGIPAFLIGVTIVSVGTSLPELIASIYAVLKDSSEIVAGNVVGSNITNIFLVLGVIAIIGKKLKVTHELIHVDLPLLTGSAFLIAIMMWDGKLTLAEAFLCLLGLGVYILYAISSQKKDKEPDKKKSPERKKFNYKNLIVVLISIVFIYLGAKYTVEAVINISEMLNIGKEIITLSAVALGTSLPELTVSVVSAKKGKTEIAVGNILGSSIFNSFGVLGIPALFGTLIIPASVISFALPVMLIATLLYFFITQDKQITKWEGGLLVIFYILFIGRLFNLI